MAAPAPLPLLLDWRAPGHWSHTAKPCRYCDRDTHLRDSKRHPACKVCAEAAPTAQAAEMAAAPHTLNRKDA